MTLQILLPGLFNLPSSENCMWRQPLSCCKIKEVTLCAKQDFYKSIGHKNLFAIVNPFPCVSYWLLFSRHLLFCSFYFSTGACTELLLILKPVFHISTFCAKYCLLWIVLLMIFSFFRVKMEIVLSYAVLFSP